MRGRIALTIAITCGTVFSHEAFAQAVRDTSRKPAPEAVTLVQKAAKADERGDGERSEELLRQALKIDSNLDVAHWLRGQVRFRKSWRSVDEMTQLASSDRRLKEYRRLVAKSDFSPESHAKLARWCRRHQLKGEERWHWLQVLEVVPDHGEALRSLGLERHEGRLYTHRQIAQLQEDAKNLRKFMPKFERLLKAIKRRDAAERKAALAELAAVSDPAAIPALMASMQIDYDAKQRLAEKLGADEASQLIVQLYTAAVDALANMNVYEATKKLVDVAIMSPDRDVRHRAAESLIPRLKTDYMPLLMAGLAAPLEVSYRTDVSADGGVTVTEELREAGQDTDTKVVRTTDYETTRFIRDNDRRLPAKTGVNRDLAKANDHTRRTKRWVAQQNNVRTMRNRRIKETIAIASGLDLGTDAEQLWKSWKDYNELSSPSENPVIESREYYDVHEYDYSNNPETYSPVFYASSQHGPSNTRSENCKHPSRIQIRYPDGNSRNGPRYGRNTPHPYVSRVRPDPPKGRRSCFAAGTPVWTRSGPMPIEMIRIGDLVLSQDPNSGRLGYRSVLVTTKRPPSPAVDITLGGETITATRGHRFWVTGAGWRMAKYLNSGYRLFGLKGSTKITSIEQSAEIEAFNLHVDEFHTYFVGNGQRLVHDNSMPESSLAIVPGVQPPTKAPSSVPSSDTPE